MDTMLVRYLRYSDGREEDIEITKDGLRLVFPIGELKDLVRQHELFVEKERLEAFIREDAAKKAIKKCTDCRYCVQQDEGYSNYTVEGTTADCLLSLNPGLPKDVFYGEEEKLLFAGNCSMYEKGEGPYIDVEDTDFIFEELDKDIQVLFSAWKLRGEK